MAFELNNPYAAQKTIQDYTQENQKIQANDQTLKDNEIKRLVSVVGPDNYAAVRQEGISKGLWSDQEAPQDYATAQPMIGQLRQHFGVDKSTLIPSAIQEYNMYKQLGPDEQQQFMNIKRGANSQYLNLGDRFMAPATGNSIEKGLPPQDEPVIKGQQKSAETAGDITTKAQADLPSVIDQANLAKKYVTEAIDSPGFDANFGIKSVVPNRPGSEASNTKALLDQIKGGTFLNAYTQLRGGGQISDVEGAKAQDAVFRMQRAQTPDAFKSAAKDYFDVLDLGIQRSQNKASGAVFNLNNPTQPINPQKTIIKTQVSPSTGKRKIIYSDGTEEIQDGQ